MLPIRSRIRPSLAARTFRAAALVAVLSRPVMAITPDEHASHHPGQSAAPAATPQDAPGMAPAGGATPMGGMGEMMGGMHGQPAGELYPSLMAMPEMTPAKRREILDQARERTRAGAGMLAEGVDRLSAAASAGDAAAMQDATARMREGLGLLESGLAARRAVADGKAPRDVALQWFRTEMNLSPPNVTTPQARSWFHAAVMTLLIAFAAAMIWMYFFKMRRAALLLRGLTGVGSAASPTTSATPAPPAPASPAAGEAAGASARKWSGPLRVGRIFQETPDVKTFRLHNPLGGVLPFSHLPGQFLTVAAPTAGKPVKRGYTIASSPTQQDHVEITVKHEPGGAVSGYLHERVLEGDLLECSGPSGSFIFTGRECKCVLLIGV